MSEQYKAPWESNNIKVEETRSSEDIEPTKEDLVLTKAEVRQPVQQGDGRFKLEDRKLLELINKMANTTVQTDTIEEDLRIGEAVTVLEKEDLLEYKRRLLRFNFISVTDLPKVF